MSKILWNGKSFRKAGLDGDRLPHDEFAREVALDLLVRLRHGIYVFPLIPALLITTTTYKSDHPWLFWGATASILIAITVRILLWLACRGITAFHPGLLVGVGALTVAMGSGASGVLLAGAVRFYGFEAWPFTVTLLFCLGVAAGSTVTFTPSFALLQLNLSALLLPAVLVALVASDSRSAAFVLMIGFFLAFLLLQGHRLHAVYWKALRDRALESARARELEAAQKAAVEANFAKGQFLANMSHEIRTPMHGILGMAQLALEAQTPEESRRHITTLRISAESLLHILNDILDFSKIEAGKLALEDISFPLRQLIADLGDLVLFQTRAKGLAFECHVADDVPDLLVGDPMRLRQLLLNLLGNAVKFTDHGAVTLWVTRTLENAAKDQAALLFRVSDTGIGIPEEQHKRIFQSFAQADGTVTRRYGGSGLGLAICAQLASLMNGSLSVQSTPGAGSTFSFACVLGVAACQPPAAELDSTPVEDQSPLKILLAEDNPVNQLLARTLLTRRGHQVTVAANGLLAIHEWEVQKFDVVLMDEQMPEMDGVEAARHIRQREIENGRARTPIVALTASAMAGDRERFLAAGMDAYLAKPFNADQLYGVIVSCLPQSEPPQINHADTEKRSDHRREQREDTKDRTAILNTLDSPFTVSRLKRM